MTAPSLAKDKLINALAASVRQRFEAMVDRGGGPDACHHWHGARFRSGYASLSIVRKTVYGSRVALALAGVELDGRPSLHSCEDRYPPGSGGHRSCVNVAHLRLGTRVENADDAYDAGSLVPPANETNPRAKLGDTGARMLRCLDGHTLTKASLRRLKALTGLSREQIYRVRRGASWATLPALTEAEAIELGYASIADMVAQLLAA